MSASNFSVNANVENVSLIYVSPTPPPGPPSPGQSSSSGTQGGSQTASGSSQGGSSTNTGAIVGGVVGGVVGAILLAALIAAAVIFARRRRNHRLAHSYPKAHPDDPKLSTFGSASVDEAFLKSGSIDTSKNGYTSKSNDLTTGSGLMSIADSARTAEVLGVRSHRSTRSLRGDFREHPDSMALQGLLSSLRPLQEGATFRDKYTMRKDIAMGRHSVVRTACLQEHPEQRVVIKFYPEGAKEAFRRTCLFYDNRDALEADAADAYVPRRLDAYPGKPSSRGSTGSNDSATSALVLDAGDFTLQAWLANMSTQELPPQSTDRIMTLYDISKAVEYMHVRSLVHGELHPNSFMWFPQQGRWKMVSIGSWAKSGEAAPLPHYDVRYTAPETLHAELTGTGSIDAAEASDMWSLGAIAYEILAKRPLFGEEYAEDQVIGMHLGLSQYPWETDLHFFHTLNDMERAFVQDLLMRNPEGRKPIRTVVHSPVFGTFNFSNGPLSTMSSKAMSLDLDDD
ncbi:hypothetical protein WJX73_004004 [Symbiochloris irregularis]|uniref:Protein kinase domain-containing protein n=1 Tax=Symbiochloris irregularis TaxID=706552 RepID=A0AAW1NZY7_9CHLO